MTLLTFTLIAVLHLICRTYCTNPGAEGWSYYLEENIEEFQNKPLEWKNGGKQLKWLSGTYVKNGPARRSFGSERRQLTNWLGGFGKLHSFKFNEGKVLFSGAMIKTPLYLASEAKGELVPQMTMNKFKTAEEEWSMMEKLDIMKNMVLMKAYDNANPMVWRLGSNNSHTGKYIACSDMPLATQFNIETLETIGILYPHMYPMVTFAATHYLREPGTDNSINIRVLMGVSGMYGELLRYRPKDEYADPQVIAQFKPSMGSYVHSFSMTENYVVLWFFPFGMEMEKMMSSNFHITEAMDNFEGKKAEAFVISMKTGSVQTISELDFRFVIHTANGYETADNKLILDVIANDQNGFHDYGLLDNMMHPPAFNDSSKNTFQLQRRVIDIEAGTFHQIPIIDTLPEHRYTHHFDFPMINEAYRGKKYCYLYGWSSLSYTHIVLTKKDLCKNGDDKTWFTENHYPGEMWFHPRSNSKSEDDGVLMTIVFDGVKRQSYMLVLDALTMKEIDTTYLPHNLPMTAHGWFFPEAHFKF